MLENSAVVMGAADQPPPAEGAGNSVSMDVDEGRHDRLRSNHALAQGRPDVPQSGATTGKEDLAPGDAVLWS